jgi:hypothetical protein
MDTRDFWSELREALEGATEAARVIGSVLHRYRGLWPHIEAEIANDRSLRFELDLAFETKRLARSVLRNDSQCEKNATETSVVA